MKKLLLVSLCFLMLCITQVFAQNRTVTGTVTAKEDGLPIPGVTVKVKGTNEGTQTNTAGKFTLSVPQGGVLVFSFIGYETQQIPVTGSEVKAVLVLGSKQLGEVVVTGALGIKKQEKEVGYATTRISGGNANETNVVNPINGLTGKVAGLVIQQTNDGIDPSVKINLRGSRSLLGNNGALIVIDGVPVSPNVLAALNSNDIEDYNVLNGSGAAALYGSEASNGAIVITTKKGSPNGKPIISYSNSLQLQQVANLPKTQSSYGQYGGEGNYGEGANFISTLTGQPLFVPYENELWGPAFNGQLVTEGYPANSPTGPTLVVPYSATGTNPVKAFFKTGVTEQNNINIAQGDAKNSVNFGAQTVNVTGITPEDASQRYTTRLSATKTIGIFKADISTSYTKTTISETGGVDYVGTNNLYDNILQFPANLNINAPYFKDVNNPTSFGNPSNYYNAYATNPWWTVENNRTHVERDVFSGNLNLTLSPTKWLDASYRVSDNFGTFNQKNNIAGVTFSAYQLSNPIAALGGQTGGVSFPNGISPRTTDISGTGDGSTSIVNTLGTTPNYNGDNGYARLEGDALLNFHHTFFNDFKTNLLLGNTIWEEKMNYVYDNSTSLLTPGFYNVSYGGTPTLYVVNSVIRQVDYFGDLSITYKTWATVEGTLRNDQDSRLATGHNSFNYPSVKFSFIPTDAFPALKGSILNYAKFYADLSRVGQVALAPYSLGNTYSVISGFPFTVGGLGSSGTNYPPGLKPEITSEQEFGTELGLFNDRLDLKADYYKQTSRNQTLSITTSPATGYNNEVVNAGSIESYGEEFSATANIFQKTGSNSVSWTLGGNLAINNSKVLSLLGNASQLPLQIDGGTGVYAVVGKAFPQLFTSDYVRDPQGKIIVNPSTGEGSINPTLTDEGRTTDKYNLGITTSVSYKIVTLTVTAEYRTGGVVYNGIGPEMTFAGSDAFSSQAGRQIFIMPNSVINTGTAAAPVYTPNTSVPVQTGGINYWVESSGSPQSVGSTYVSSSAFWKIREIALDFNLNKYVKNSKTIKGLTFGLDARNVFTFLPKSEMWGDPELSDASSGINSGNGVGLSNGTVGSYQLPSSRYFGAKLQVTF